MKRNLFSKKALGAVIATSLLIVVAVITLVLFNSWFQTYSSNLMVDVETQSSINAIPEIEGVIGDFVYIKTPINMTIDRLLVDGNECDTNVSMTQRMQGVNISSCLSGLSTSTPKITLITDNNIVTTSVYLKDAVVGSGTSSLSCPTGYIPVPGSSTYGTSDFCVMKYEAKNVGGIANSTASGTIWVSQTWQQAQTNCENLGAGYHLITDNEWLTIAKDAEQQWQNWNSSVVGTGFMFSGHNDNSPGSALLADTNDSNGYYLTDNSAGSNQRRTLTLSNGEVIWDLAGNVWEWVNYSMPIASRYHGGDQAWMSYSSDDGTGKIASLVPALKIPSSGWNANNGMGRYYDGASLAGAYNSISEAPDFCTGYCSPTAVFLRGGSWTSGVRAGAFALTVNDGPSASLTSDGFRCSYAP